MLIMIPFVFLVNGVTKGDWLEAFIFAVSVAVGLTPEMLPMVVTANLAKGAVAMSKKKTIVKDLNAIQNFGAMNILCTDKTGTLTCDQIVLEKYINDDGSNDESRRILRHAYFNSFFQTGLKNLMDKAILSHVKDLSLEYLKDNYTKVDEIPFDFTRRRMSVVVEDRQGKRQIITKGAVEEMLDICSHAEFDGEVHPMAIELKNKARDIIEQMNKQGMRVIAVAHKSYLDKTCDFRIEDEKDMVLIGYLAFLDPPKQSAASAIKQLHEHGIEIKILSGDNDAVVRTIARQVGIRTDNALTGPIFETMSEEEKMKAVNQTTVFSKLTPIQKTEIITLLQAQQHTVGFLGDGINDAAALRQSDIGISVDSRSGHCQRKCRHYPAGEKSDGTGRRCTGRTKNIWQHHQIHQDDSQFQLRKHVQRNGGQCVPSLPTHAPHPPADSKSAVRYFADPDCAHDTYPESPLHTKLCLLASNRTYPADYGHRYPAAFHPVWKHYRAGSTAIKLFPLAHRYPVVLLHTDSIN